MRGARFFGETVLLTPARLRKPQGAAGHHEFSVVKHVATSDCPAASRRFELALRGHHVEPTLTPGIQAIAR